MSTMPDIRPLTIAPHPTLRKKSEAVALDKKTIEVVRALEDTLYAKTNPSGVGLSAPQIGKNMNIFATWLAKDVEQDPVKADLKSFINPIVTNHSKETTFGPNEEDPVLEGCLSIPGLYGPVPRYEWVELAYTTYHKGEFVTQEERFESFFARVVQHEYDHLIGVLFTDYSLKYDLPVYEFVGKKMNEIDKTIVESF